MPAAVPVRPISGGIISNKEMTTMTTEPIGTWATVKDYAKYRGQGRSTIYLLMDRGLPNDKIGRSRRINVALADAWLAAGHGASNK